MSIFEGTNGAGFISEQQDQNRRVAAAESVPVAGCHGHGQSYERSQRRAIERSLRRAITTTFAGPPCDRGSTEGEAAFANVLSCLAGVARGVSATKNPVDVIISSESLYTFILHLIYPSSISSILLQHLTHFSSMVFRPGLAHNLLRPLTFRNAQSLPHGSSQ